jgi:ABC-type transport system involved in cytochrome c biogenesis permease component
MNAVLIMPITATIFVLGLDKPTIYVLVKIFPIVTLLIICISAFASALTLGYSAGRMLISIVSLPLMIPIFILGSSQVAGQEIYLLLASCFLLPVLILGICFSLRLAIAEH